MQGAGADAVVDDGAAQKEPKGAVAAGAVDQDKIVFGRGVDRSIEDFLVSDIPVFLI